MKECDKKKDELKASDLLDALENLYVAENKNARDQEEEQKRIIRDVAKQGAIDPESSLTRWKDIQECIDKTKEFRALVVGQTTTLTDEERGELVKLLDERLKKRFDDIRTMAVKTSELKEAVAAWAALPG
jgi:hypothetical protein